AGMRSTLRFLLSDSALMRRPASSATVVWSARFLMRALAFSVSVSMSAPFGCVVFHPSFATRESQAESGTLRKFTPGPSPHDPALLCERADTYTVTMPTRTDEYRDALDSAHAHATGWLQSVSARPVGPRGD